MISFHMPNSYKKRKIFVEKHKFSRFLEIWRTNMLPRSDKLNHFEAKMGYVWTKLGHLYSKFGSLVAILASSWGSRSYFGSIWRPKKEKYNRFLKVSRRGSDGFAHPVWVVSRRCFVPSIITSHSLSVTRPIINMNRRLVVPYNSISID